MRTVRDLFLAAIVAGVGLVYATILVALFVAGGGVPMPFFLAYCFMWAVGMALSGWVGTYIPALT